MFEPTNKGASTCLVYCEDGAVTKALRALQREGTITLVAFPYENRNRRIKERAQPSRITMDAKFITWADTAIRFSDRESDMFERIQSIVGRGNEIDVRHIDSAYKTGCRCFFTRDKGDILRVRAELEALLGIRFFHPDADLDAFKHWLEEGNA